MMESSNLGSRVLKLETKQDEYERQKRDHEDRQRAQDIMINKMAENIAVMNSTLHTLTEKVLPKVELMENQVVKNTMITQVTAWVAGALVAGCITAVVALIK